MPLPTLNPHALGCPLALAVDPQEMQRIVPHLCLKLRDVAFPTIHVVTPSKGDAYPMLNLHVSRDESIPRLVFTPAWEDVDRSRRITWKRQATLLKRIHDAGVEGDPIDVTEVDDKEGTLVVCVAVSAPDMLSVLHDLNDYFGDIVRLTVGQIRGESLGPDIMVIRMYAPNAEKEPRVMFLPAWTGVDESPGGWMTEVKRKVFVRQANRTAEVPVEVFLTTR